MNNEDILSGNTAAIHKNEVGETTHFETVGKNSDGSYNISSWHRDSLGAWGAYHIGSYDAASAIRAFNNFQGININNGTSSIAPNPLTPVLNEPKHETVVKEHRTKAKAPDKEESKSPSLNPPTEQKEPQNDERPAEDTPQTESPDGYTGGTLLEDLERWIPSLTADAHAGVQSLKNDLNDYVLEGGNWFGAALAGTALDVADAAMSFTEGIPLGFLDTRNIGEGLAEGTWEGAKKDISRALNVLPQGKILRAVDRAMTASNVIESAEKGDLKGAALGVGLGVLSSKSRGKGKSNKTEPLSKHLDKEQITVVEHLQSNVFNKERFELVSSFAKGEPGLRNISSAVSTALHDRAKMDLKKQFGSSIEVKDNIALRKMGKQNIDLVIDFKSNSNSKMKVELKTVAWLDGGKLKTPWTVHGKNRSQIKQLAAIQMSAKKNPQTPHLIVTPKDTFVYSTSERNWIKLQK